MISDVLHDAIHDIRHYQKEMPEHYAGIREWIDSVVQEMEALRRFLDTPLLANQIHAMRQFLYCPTHEQRKWLVQVLPEPGKDEETCRAWLAQLRELKTEDEDFYEESVESLAQEILAVMNDYHPAVLSDACARAAVLLQVQAEGGARSQSPSSTNDSREDADLNYGRSDKQ